MFKKKWSRSDIPESVSADSEKEHPAPDMGAEWNTTSEEKPSDEKIVSSLAGAREELGRLRKTFGSCENIVTLALANVTALERRCAALEKESREVARPPQADQSVAQKISELRESLEDESPREAESSSSKEEEYILVASVRGIDEDGRLLLGDRKILSASALKI